MILVKMRRADEGIAEFKKCLRLTRPTTTARFNIGFAHLLKAELDQGYRFSAM